MGGLSCADALASKCGTAPLLSSQLGGVAVGVCLSAVPTLRGALRACNFWWRTFPFFLRYKWAEWRIHREEKTEQAREQRWDRLHDCSAPFLLRHILEFCGTSWSSAGTLSK